MHEVLTFLYHHGGQGALTSNGSKLNKVEAVDPIGSQATLGNTKETGHANQTRHAEQTTEHTVKTGWDNQTRDSS